MGNAIVNGFLSTCKVHIQPLHTLLHTPHGVFEDSQKKESN
jgi:hypothetical protein